MGDNVVKRQSEDYYLGLRLENVRKGLFNFQNISNPKHREIIENELIKDIEAGTINDGAYKTLIKYKYDQIKRNKITIDDVNPIIRNDVEKMLNK